MKKIAVFLLMGTMALSICACGKSEDNSEKTDVVTYEINYNANAGNMEGMPDYQFLGTDISAIAAYDSRLNIEITLQLYEDGQYELTSDCYVVEADERQEPGSESGIGQKWISNITGTYVENEDGTITTSEGKSMTLKVETDTYSSQIKDAVGFSINGSSEDGEWNSSKTPEILEFAPETVFQVEGDAIVSYYNPNEKDDEQEIQNEEVEEAETEEAENIGAVLLEIPSDDEATTFTFYDNGKYTFYFSAYDITDEGNYTYTDGILVITDKNGTETSGILEGDTIKVHYAYSDSDQLTGDYTIAVADLKGALN